MDYKEIERQMKELGYPTFAGGKNENGENVVFEIDISNGERVYKISTFQKNGWCRTNVYYKDGTIEELFDK